MNYLKRWRGFLGLSISILFLSQFYFLNCADASGVLFYAFKDGKAYLLLSQDMHHDERTEGSWTDCGGKIDPGSVALSRTLP